MFYKQRMNKTEAERALKEFKTFCSLYCQAITTDDLSETAFFFNPGDYDKLHQQKIITWIRIMRMYNEGVDMPFGDGYVVFFTPQPQNFKPTASKTHLKMPKLSHLITLSPEDFFTLIQILYSSETLSSNSLLKLDLESVNINDIESETIAPFFKKERINYRLNHEFCDRKWTRREALHVIADLEPTEVNAYYAMQYLTAIQNPDLLYFPLNTAVELELDWPQITDDYCVPQPEQDEN